MLRRCVRELSLGRSLGRRRIAAQMPYLLSSRNEFSSAVHRNASQKPSPEKPATENSQSGISKLVVGSLVVGAAFLAAYQSGYIDQLQSKNEKSSIGSNKLDNVETLEEDHSANQVVLPSNEKMLVSNEDTAEKNELHQVKDSEVHKEGILETSSLEEKPLPAKDNELATLHDETVLPPAKQTSDPEVLSEGCINTDTKIDHIELSGEQEVGAQTSTTQNEGINVPIHVSEDTVRKEDAHHDDSSMEIPKDLLDNESEAQKSLAQAYGLEEGEGSPAVPGKTESTDVASMLKNEEVSSAASKVSMDNSGSGRVLVDLIEAIHAAETKQAESDAYIFAEEKRKLKEKYEKEIKDARARQLMYAEEAAILDKELNKEKAKAAATIKLLQEKAEQKLLEELKHKEEEADRELKKVQELSKAELAAAIASEKAAQIEKIAEANLHINALCMAFYARSEEARQSHSVHKLALGTLALEDALSKGLPIRSEINALRMSLEGIDRDSLLDLALSSLPVETLNHGTNTQMQLNQKFDSLKGILRHFSLIPAGGGGLLAHAVAHVASLIKMREDEYGDGVESLISRVEKLLVAGRLADAADALEVGVRGTEAAGVAVEWVTQARNRAVAEQALSILQSYATSITFS